MKEENSQPQSENSETEVTPQMTSDTGETQANESASQQESPSGDEVTAKATPEPEHKALPDSEEHFMDSHTPHADEESTDEDSDHDEAESDEDISALSVEEQVALLEKYVDEVEVPRFKARIAAIRDLLQQSFSHLRDDMLNAYLEDGGVRDDFEPAPNPLEVRFDEAIRKFNKKRVDYHKNVEKERSSNLEGKREILNQLKDLIQNEENMNKAFDRFHELQAAWRALGPVPSADVRDLHMTYKVMVDKFYDFIKINRELQELDQRRNLESKLLLCEQAEALLLEPGVNNALKALHQIQDKWRETGPVPRDKKDEIWDRFKTACDKLFDKRREVVQVANEQRQKNYDAKVKLCEEAEALVTDENFKHKDWQETTEKIAAIQAAWKKTGRADKKVNDEIWARFKKACDVFYKAKNEFYNQRKQEFASNLQLKTELCIQAEALQNNTDWKTTTAELIKLQEQWKNIGHVGERQSDKIWKRFRKACDAFFKNKAAHFADRDKDFEENYVKKTELISRIEQFNPGENHQQSFEELKNFQREWSELGMVPMNKKEEINKKYKTVIDAQFDKIKISSADRQKMRYQNKLEHIRNTHDPKRMDGEKRFLLNKIAELKNEVQTWENNIGFFAKSKNADKLKQEFEEKIAKAKEEIGQLQTKLKMADE